jgi:deoxyribodipyrimidine photo-lyase
MVDTGARCTARWGQSVAAVTTAAELIAFADAQKASAVVTTRVPIGYVRTELDDWISEASAAALPIFQIQRRWDQLFWPHASVGFFKLKERIPAVLDELQLSHRGAAA